MEEVGFEKYSMEKRVSKAEQRLTNYAKRAGMSEAGKHWLMAAVDPFHDKPLQINGYPDGTPGKSLVQCVKMSTDVSKPSALPAGATWDFMINTDNLLTPKPLLPFSVFSGGLYQPTAVAAPGIVSATAGGLIIRSGISGEQLNGYNGSATNTLKTVSIGNEFLEGKLRVLAMGFEVCNTTADLYKNGAVTVFEVPQELPEERFTVSFGNQTGGTPPTASAGSCSLLKVSSMPNTISQATQITGAQTWEAKDGCYCVCRQNGLFNPAVSPKAVGALMTFSDSVQPYPVPTSPGYINASGGTSFTVNDSITIPFHSKGAYFTGLNENSTFRVNYNVWIERFPTPSEINFLSLATESCDYDPQALEAWAIISGEAPSGVMFKENGLGDWFTGQIASLIDHWTGTTIASDVDNWQKNYALGTQVSNGMAKRDRMNTKAAVKGKAPKQGPMLPNGSFKTQQAKNAKRNKAKPLPQPPRK